MSTDTHDTVDLTSAATPEGPDTRTAQAVSATAAAEVAGPLAWLRRRLVPLWRDHRIAAAVTLAIPAGWGVAAGWWMPRGPMTSGHALWSVVIGLAVGVAAGLVARSRWAALAAPVAFAAVFEATRLGTDGPTVDGIRFSTYGVLALVVGRGVHGLVALLPMVWGSLVGAALARRVRSEPPTGRRPAIVGRRVVAVLTGLALLALTLGLARPARTDAIRGTDGKVLDGSVAELTSIDVNGHELAMMIRGHSVDAPVLLFLAGGPGGSEMGAMRNHLPELEEHFVVVTWDQRGTGKSYGALDPASTYTLPSAVEDTIAVTNHLRERFGQDQIFLLGQSWGSLLGVLAVQAHPELYQAFIGSGQMVSPLATDLVFYEDTLAWAQAQGDSGLVDRLTDIGPPPYDDMLSYETALGSEHEVYPYDRRGNSEGEGGFSENFFVEEYALIDQLHLLGAFMDTFSVLYPQIQGLDLRESATTLEVPVYFAQGAHEAPGRAELFEAWYAALDAPVKQVAVLDTSGHRPLFEQPDEFVDFMRDTVLASSRAAG